MCIGGVWPGRGSDPGFAQGDANRAGVEAPEVAQPCPVVAGGLEITANH